MISDRNGFRSTHGNHTAKRASNGRRKGSTSPPVGEQVRDRPLVAQDGLFFRVIPGVRDALPHQDFDPDVIAQTFRAAFTGVWEQIPPADRQRMLIYSACNPFTRQEARPADPGGLSTHGSRGRARRWGMELTFPTTLVAANHIGSSSRLPARWPRFIALRPASTGAWSWK